MKLNTFFDNFELLADAPNGIPKLREMILQLAVQGKLMPQDPSDEPASELLKKIKKEKERLIEEGKLRKQKPMPEIKEEERPFVLPEGWNWCRLGDSGAIFNGNSLNSLQKTSYSKVANGLPYISTKHVGYGTLQVDYSGEIKIPINEPKFKIAHKNAVLICSEGGSAGRKIGLIDRDICFGNKLLANETYTGVLAKFIFYMYQTPFFSLSFKAKMTGIIGGISISNFLGLIIPLPPFEEQKRIVEKVDQFMVLCDELEARKNKRNDSRIVLNDAALDRLLTAKTPDELAKHWHRISSNFDLLYDNPENVDKLRKAILQLAVQGKLVPQDPSDEPAAVLLKKIKSERERSVKEGKIKKTKPVPPVSDDEKPFGLPKGWEWTRLGIIAEIIMGQSPPGSSYNDIGEGIPLINGPVEFSNGDFGKTIKSKFTTKPTKMCEKNELLLCVRGSTTGRTNIANFVACIGRGVAAIRSKIYPKYINWLVVSLREHIFSIGTGSTFPSISYGKIVELICPLPPANEQKRIVAKLEQLMALCDELETKLSQSHDDIDKLLEASIQQAIAA